MYSRRHDPAIEATGRHAYRGFTLLELIVVLLILGIVAGFAVLSVSTADGDRGAGREARRLKALLALAAQEAVVQGRPVALALARNGYHFLILRGEGWSRLQDDVLAAGELADGLRFDARVEGRGAVVPHEPGTAKPHVVFQVDGLTSSFTITIRDDSRALVTLEGNTLGEVTLSARGGAG